MNKDIIKVFNFLNKVENLKATLRIPKTKTGRQESSAEHTWRVSLMVFLIAEELKLKINVLHSIKIAIVHDLAESITGDYCSYDVHTGKILKSRKEKEETNAMKKLRGMLPQNSGKMIYDLWNEYEEQKTKEAKFIKALERIETLAQFIETDASSYGGPEYTAIYADEAVRSFPELKDLLEVIKRDLKKAYKKNNIEWKKEYNLNSKGVKI